MNDLKPPMQRNLFFSSQFDQKTIMELSKSIIDINDNDLEIKYQYGQLDMKYKPKPIKIFIDSYGGHVYQCLGLIGIVEQSKVKVETIVTGSAKSCGFLLLIAGHERFSYKHSTGMYHQITAGSPGKIQDILEDLEECERLQKWIEQLTIRRTKIKQEKLTHNRKTKFDWYMSADEMLKNGVVDKII